MVTRVWWYEAMNCDDGNATCHAQWQTVHIAALIPAVISSVASIFIIVTAIKYRRELSKLTVGAQLPIFISFCDLCYEIFHGGDHLHNVIHDYVSEGALCQLFGCMKPFFINCQTAWALGVAFYLTRTIFKQTCDAPDFGPYNLYLHAPCWGIPCVILVIGFGIGAYGVEGPWCGIPNPLTDILMVDMWMVIAIILLIVNYGCIMYKLNNVIKLTDGTDNRAEHAATNKRIKNVIRTIGLYPVAYFVQWFAYVLYKTYVIERAFWSVLWVVMTGNAGGIFNLFLYGPLFFNQLKRELRKDENHVAMELSDLTQPKQSGANTATTTSSTGHVAVSSNDLPSSPSSDESEPQSP